MDALRYCSVCSKRRTVPLETGPHEMCQPGRLAPRAADPQGKAARAPGLTPAEVTTHPEVESTVLIVSTSQQQRSVMDKDVTGVPIILSNDPVASFG